MKSSQSHFLLCKGHPACRLPSCMADIWGHKAIGSIETGEGTAEGEGLPALILIHLWAWKEKKTTTQETAKTVLGQLFHSRVWWFSRQSGALTRQASQAAPLRPCSLGSGKWLSVYFKWGKLRMVFQYYLWLSYVKRFLWRVIIGAVFRNDLVTNA